MRKKTTNGIIIKGIGGFYYVEAFSGLIECKAKGAFRKEKISPLAGDRVLVSSENIIEEIEKRKNFLIRPPVANLDNLFIVVSSVDPKPNFFVIDKMIAIAENNNIKPIIIASKNDLHATKEIEETYKNVCENIFSVGIDDVGCKEEIIECMRGKVSAFCGNSGVGKSTLLNNLFSNLSIKTGDTSQKLGRGRHTTRETTLYKFDENSYIADTPGFSAIELEHFNKIDKNDLSYCFRDFHKYLGKCKFGDCSHTKETGCAVIDAVERGEIEKSRFESYVTLYDELKKIPDWSKE